MEPRHEDGGARAALPGFVSTTVLTSADGLFGDNVEEKRILEAPAPSARDAADYKPLYERLQDMKDQKDREWKEKNNPYAPPKALDDEEIEFIRDLESRKADSETQRQEQQREDIAEFMLAREAAKNPGAPSAKPVAAAAPVTLSNVALKKLVKPQEKASAPVIVVKTKRKAQDKTTKKTTTKDTSKKQKVETETETTTTTATVNKPAVAALGLVGYGSDSDSDES
ncbi:hypothetical protein Poli38472_008508 [Pythium oligandrum]|uniref:FAM192A/Fyv6 N-terminal domain-containing protein n=1 Tax=Pythium oligandrum TaxID=41045 RepID=A0A8K1FA38_PYTOL|nr:hypothetical protein Poli38472_008508 [Pythium oligandrum]|eukprot:TMW55860.1 hypothetical protein Poli38472_008508 [Pythium oligandrum]